MKLAHLARTGLAALALASTPFLDAATFRWSSAGDITVPGQTVFTRMPSGASARARFFEALAIAALAAVWAIRPGLW